MAVEFSDLADLEAKYAAAEAELNSISESLSPAQMVIDASDEVMAEAKKIYEAAVAKAKEDRRVAENLIWQSRGDLRRAQEEAERIKRMIEQERARLAFENETLTMEKRWDALTADCVWREQAKDHQLIGAKRMVYAENMILADVMGTGKTLTAKIAIDMLKASEKGGRKVLWFCPASVMRGAERELKKWQPENPADKDNIVILGGKNKIERRLLIDAITAAKMENLIFILNYEIWRKDFQLITDLYGMGFDTIIVDEAHNIKNLRGPGWRGIAKIAQAETVKQVYLMTGTPILNRPQELFSLLALIKPEVFCPYGIDFSPGSRTMSQNLNRFLDQYCVQIKIEGQPRWTFAPGGLDRLGKRLSNFYLRRTKKEAGLNLPDPEIKEYELTLDPEKYPEQHRVYTKMRDEAMIILDPDSGSRITAAAIIALYTRLRQLITAPTGVVIKDEDGMVVEKVDVQESVKLDFCIEAGEQNEDGSYSDPEGIIPEVISDSKVVLYSQFTEPLDIIHQRCTLAGYTSAVYDGRLNEEKRDAIKQRFVSTKLGDPDGIDILLCNYKVGAVGLDGLQTVSDQMILLDSEWNPGKRDQAIDRLNRWGQESQVTVHKPIVVGTIDSWLESLMNQKEDLVGGFDQAMSVNASDLFNAIKRGEV